MESKLCPKCGAYWKCDCNFEVVEVKKSDLDAMALPAKPGCNHDWTEAVGVELSDDLSMQDAQVLVCRLCGLYSVEEKSA